MWKKMFVVLMCVFLMAWGTGTAFAVRGNDNPGNEENQGQGGPPDDKGDRGKDHDKGDRGKDRGQIQGQMQGQIQGQMQGQNQGQTQTAKANAKSQSDASANNEGVQQDVTIEGDKIEADKRDLIEGPVLSLPDAKLGDGKASVILTKGSIFTKTKTLTRENLKTLLPNGGAGFFMSPKAKVDPYKLLELEKTGSVTYGKPEKGKYVGTVYVISEGAPLIALEALAAEAAMNMGGSHLIAAETDSFVSKSGDAAGFSVGGNASGFAKGDDIAVAPGAMLGWSKVTAKNEAFGAVMFEIYAEDMPVIPAK